MAIADIQILARVGAGKTTLTARIPFETGLLGSAGDGNKVPARIDVQDQRRARGVTIAFAVVSFHPYARKLTCFNTPEPADFVVEVGRSPRVLDGVALVVSAGAAVQPRARRLPRAIRAVGHPLLPFGNPIDRLAASGGTRSSACTHFGP